MATMLEPRIVPDQLRQAQRGVIRRLERVRRRLRGHLLVEGLFFTVTALLVAAAVSLALDRWLRFNLPTRLGLLAIEVAAILAVTWRRLVRPLLLPLDDLDLAQLLDRRAPQVGQQIANVLQLPELAEDYASPEMVQAAVAECCEALDRVDLAATFNVARRNKLLAACGAWLLIAASFCVLWPATAELWARRWLAGSTVRWPQDTYLSILGLGDGTSLLVPRGEMSLLQINALPQFARVDDHWQVAGRGETLIVESDDVPESGPPDQISIAYALADGTKKRGHAVQFDETNFRYELPPLAEPVELNIVGGDDWLGPITIEPIDRPAISSLEIVTLRPGSSDKHSEQVGEAGSQYLYLPETQVELRLVADQPLESAQALDKGLPAEAWQRVDERTYTLRWTMKESLALEFRMVGRRGVLSSKPYFLAIGLLRDREPRFTARSSGVGRRITPVARIPLALRATDDFGVASLALEWERTEIRDDKPQVTSQREELEKESPPADAPPRIEVDLDHEFELRERGLAPGNLLKLRGVATDNCALGTQSGASRWLSFQIVSSDELFYEILMRQREQRAKFNTAVDSAKLQDTAIEGLANPQEAIGIARAHQVISRQVWQIANQLEASLQEMTLNDLGNPQAREMLQSGVITPLRTLHADLLTKLRTAVDGLAQASTVSEDRRAEAQTISEQAVKAMQTILAQMAQWESFVDVINQLKQIIDRQDDVLKTTEEIEKKRTDELFDK